MLRKNLSGILGFSVLGFFCGCAAFNDDGRQLDMYFIDGLI
jgi:hypothetical protein